MVNQLSFLSCDLFYAMLSPAGLEHMQSFIDKFHAEESQDHSTGTESLHEPSVLKLEELMSKAPEENKHELIDFGKPVGKEF